MGGKQFIQPSAKAISNSFNFENFPKLNVSAIEQERINIYIQPIFKIKDTILLVLHAYRLSPTTTN